MKVKRFVAADMRRALDLVKQEMGPDAVILSTSRTKQGVEVLTSLATADQWSDLPKKVANDSEFLRKKSGVANGISLSALKGKKLFNGGRDVDDIDESAMSPLQSDVAWGSTTPFGRLMEKQYQQAAGEQQPQSRTETIRPTTGRSETGRSETIRPSQYRPIEDQYANERRGIRAQPSPNNLKRYEIHTDEEDYVEQDHYIDEDRFAQRDRYVETDHYAEADRFVDYREHSDSSPSDSNDLERAALAHKNLQAAMDEFEKAYQAIKYSRNTESVAVENKIHNRTEFEQPEPRSKHQNEIRIQKTATTAQPLAQREHQADIIPPIASANNKVQMEKRIEPKIEVEANSATNTDEKPEVDTQGISSWWNTAFQFGSYQVNYNPEYQLYLPEYDESEASGGANQVRSEKSKQDEKNSAVVQMQQELQDVKAVLQGEAVVDEARPEQTIANKVQAKSTASRGKLIELLDSIKHRNPVTAATDEDDDNVAEVKANKKRPMFTLVETPKVQSEVAETLFSETRLKALQQPGSAELQSLISEIADMRELLQTQLDRLAQQGTATSGASVSELPLHLSSINEAPIRATLKRRLLNLGLAAAEIDMLLAKVDLNSPLNEAWTEVLAVLAHQLPMQGSDIVDKGGFFAFVGSPGCGKTTTISKLATRYVLKHGAKGVAIVSMASSSLSNNNSLKRLGHILKIPVHKVSDIKHLRYQLDELCEYKLVLIDTAGLRYGDPALKPQLSALRQLPQVKNILVLAANTQLQLMKASVHAFRAADLCACVLTKVDDTISLGEAFSAVLQEKLPIAYTSSGQDFTKDIQVARAHQVVARAVSLLKMESKRQLRIQVENTRRPALLNR